MTKRFKSLILMACLLLVSTVSAQEPSAKGRALVLGGGGPVGIAWETGLVAGLAEKGVNLSQASYILGTSAGSVVGANLALGRTPKTMLETQLKPPVRPAGQPSSEAPDLRPLMAHLIDLVSGQKPPEQVRRDIGQWALSTPTIRTEHQFVGVFAKMFPDQGWTKNNFQCVAVDTGDGSYKVWNKDSGVDLASAVASSCAVPGIFPPVTINGRRYMDGGMRSATNADLATGYREVVVVAVTGGPPTSDLAKRSGAVRVKELEALEDSGAHVDMIVPDAASRAAFGPNLMDSNHREQAARAGLAQGEAEAAALAPSWNK